MTLLTYSRGRLQLGMFLFALIAIGALIQLAIWSSVTALVGTTSMINVRVNWILPAYLLFTGAVMWRLWALLLGDGVALRALPEGLQVTNLFGRSVIKWDQLLGSHHVEYGNLIFRLPWLKISYVHDGSPRTRRLPLVLTRMPLGGRPALSQKMEQARDEALAGRGTFGGSAANGAALDPDAVIQRYLQAKAQAAAAAPAEIAPVTEPQAAPPARQPLRPAFGRKGL